MGCVSTRGYVICLIIVISLLSTNAIPSEDQETPKDGSSLTSADSPRHERDLSETPSTGAMQAILPVQVDIGNLVSGFNDHIDEMRENMTNLDEKLEIVKANEARVEEENRRLIEQLNASKENEAKARKSWEDEKALLIEQLKISKENEAKARNASKAKADSPTAGFTWKAILGGCVNSSDMDDWTLLLHNRNSWIDKHRKQRKWWGDVYSQKNPFHASWEGFKKGFVYQHSLKEASDAYWYGLERMHRRTSVGRWRLVLSYVCRDQRQIGRWQPGFKGMEDRWTPEKSYNVCVSYDNFKVGGEDSFYDFHIGSELNRWGSGKGWRVGEKWGSKGWDFSWYFKHINGTRFRTWDNAYDPKTESNDINHGSEQWTGSCFNCHRNSSNDFLARCYGGFWYSSEECTHTLHPTGILLNLHGIEAGDRHQCEHVFMAMKKI